MAKQTVFGADDLRHPEHVGPNPFADAGAEGQEKANFLASTTNASEYEPTSYAPALAPRGRRLMILGSTGTLLAFLFAVLCGFTEWLFVPYHIALLMTAGLTLPSITMSTQDLRAMQAGAMNPTDHRLTMWARRIAIVGLAVAVVACWQLIRLLGEAVVTLFS